ncbi:MAG TPA: TRAP transporter large permease [Alphaproteobacteria bacterium]|nr:TRAP transporter large permease [Alphaproteobacteria bacterium]
MENYLIAALSLGAMFLALALGMPIGFAMGLAGTLGVMAIIGVGPGFALLGQTAYEEVITQSLSVVPLFVLMGFFASQSGLSAGLYRACNTWIGHRRGGLALATIGACGAFAAICGSSLATAATMSQVALPEMRRYNYDMRLATGSIAAGGTIGILIPPSVILVLYGILTETNIGELFIAGIVPGLLTIIFFMATIVIVTQRNPELGPRGVSTTGRQKLAAFKDVWGTLLLFLLVIGGIYTGAFSPTEAASIGAAGAFNLAAIAFAGSAAGLPRRLLPWAVWSLIAAMALIMIAIIWNLLAGHEPTDWPDWLRWVIVVPLACSQILMLAIGRYMYKDVATALLETAKTTGMIFMILIGAIIVNKFLLISGLAEVLGSWVENLDMSRMAIMVVILLIYLVLGCALDALAMILLTIPIFFPIVQKLGFDPIWFGIIIVMVVELGLITPPIGMNVFVIKGLAPTVPLGKIYRGVTPFVIAEILLIILLLLVPDIATLLPKSMGAG